MSSTVPQLLHSQNSQCGRYTVLGDHSPQSPSTVVNCGGRIVAKQQITVENEKVRALWKLSAPYTFDRRPVHFRHPSNIGAHNARLISSRVAGGPS